MPPFSRTEISANRIVVTGMSSTPRIPEEYIDIASSTHSCALSGEQLQELRGKRVAVVGGSKSAADAVLALQERGASIHWFARKFYTYAPYASGTSMTARHVLSRLPAMLLRGADALFDLRLNANDQLNKGTGNLLTEEELGRLQLPGAHRRHRGVPIGARETEEEVRLTLEGEPPIVVDHVVLATGYEQTRLAGEETLGKHLVLSVRPPDGYFGMVGAHVSALAVSDYIQLGERQPFEEWAPAQLGALSNAYFARYLLSDGPIGSYREFQWSFFIVLLAFLLLLALLTLVRATRHRKCASMKGTASCSQAGARSLS